MDIKTNTPYVAYQGAPISKLKNSMVQIGLWLVGIYLTSKVNWFIYQSDYASESIDYWQPSLLFRAAYGVVSQAACQLYIIRPNMF